jgi:nitroimidazol reductase NimA-like FMN-containing flavoprotein (pyridoxamine 5'-phosphate oxidase superfamily)
MSVRLTEDEAWEMLGRAHTGIITTLRRDGWPVSLPMWFSVVDRKIYMRTLAGSKKALRIKRDERACFMVESGEAWKDLAAVVIPVRASLIDPDGDEAKHALAAIGAKYQGFGPAEKQIPEATKKHYGAANVMIRLDPAGDMITWNNAKIRLKM